MTIIPSIDLLGGECVRLYRGSYSSAQSYSKDPVDIALRFEKAGAEWIHIVDLDAARDRTQNNRHAIERIRKAVSCSLETGGGIKSSDDIDELLSVGINRLVLGTALVRNPEQVARWCSEYGKIFLGGIDALAGQVRVSGWQEGSTLEDLDLADKAAGLGLAGVIYTNISRDGTLKGPDIVQTNRVAEVSGLPVILSGGISSGDDVLKVIREKHPGVIGVIIGKAIYEKRLDLGNLIRDCRDI